MGPYRQAAVDQEAELDRQELADFASVHQVTRKRSLAGGLGFSVMLIASTLLWAFWFYQRQHGAFASFH